MGEVGEEVEANVVPDKKIEESSINLEKYSAYFVTTDEKIEAAAIFDQHNEEAVEDEVRGSIPAKVGFWVGFRIFRMCLPSLNSLT